jgi:hypothetical protein
MKGGGLKIWDLGEEMKSEILFITERLYERTTT